MTYGPWIQPADQWGPYIATGRGVGTTKFADPTTNDPDLAAISSVDVDFYGAGINYDSRVATIGAGGNQGLAEINPSSAATSTMPPVVPVSLPAGATGWEYESPAGSLAGDIKAYFQYSLFTSVVPTGFHLYSDAYWLTQLSTVLAELRQVPAGDVSLGGDDRYHSAGDWVPRATRSGYALLWSFGMPTPTSDSYNDGLVSSSVVTIAAASLSSGKAFILASTEAPSSAVNFDGLFYNGGSTLHGYMGAGIDLFTGDGTPGAHMSAFYRPPRYRFVYPTTMLPDTSFAAEVRAGARLVTGIRMDGG